METNNQHSDNSFTLAQYIIAEPDKHSRYDHLDISPALEKLEEELILHFTSLFIRKEIHDLVKESKHPNAIMLVLAKKADEICPGRTHSDLMYKAIIVTHVFENVMRALYETAGRRVESKIVMGNLGNLGRFGGLSSMLNDLKS